MLSLIERTIAAPGAGRGRQTLEMVNEVPPLPQRIREWPHPRGGGLSWSTAKPHQILAYLYGRTDMTGVDVIGAVRHDAERHTRNFGYDGVQNEGLTPGVKVDIKRFPENSAVGVPTAARFGCKTNFALHQIDAQTWKWQLMPAETTTHLMPNGVRPALYISVIQPHCQAEYGGITQESRAASDRLDRPFSAPLSPSLVASQVPRRQAEAETQAAAPRRQAAAAASAAAPAARRQASEQPRGTVATSMASAAASVVPPLIPLQKRRIRGISGVSSTESASPTEFPGPTVFDTDVDRQADSTVKQEEADLQVLEDLALADSLNTALPGRHEDDEEVPATQQDGEEDAVDEGEEEEEMEEEEEEVATRQAQVAPPPQEGVVQQGDVISQCLRSQARARGQLYKGAPAVSAVAIACVLSLISFSPRHARQCRCGLNCFLPTSFRARRIRPSVRQLALLMWTVCALLPLPLLAVGRTGEVVRVLPTLRQTVAPLPPPLCSRDSVRQHLPLFEMPSVHMLAIAQVRLVRLDPKPGS